MSTDTRAPARAPISAPATIAPLGILLALATIWLGVTLLQDWWASITDSTSWLGTAISALQDLEPAWWLVPLGILLLLLGLWLIVAGLKPRRPSMVQLRSDTAQIWLRPRDISSLAVDATRSVSGVLEASAGANVRNLTVDITTNSGAAHDLPDHVREAVGQRLAMLENPPTLRVNSHVGGLR